MSFIYNLSQTEYLRFKTQPNSFELYSGHEGGAEPTKIASFKGGKWQWESFDQQKLFWSLYKLFTSEFGRAIKAYNRSLKEKPALYEFQCVRKKFSLKVTRIKRGWGNWFYDTFYTRNR
jgi:hypothetical protein